MNTLVCLVSRQVMANLIPVLTLNVKKVELLFTKEERRSHKNLRTAIEGTGLNLTINEHLIDAYDFKGIQKICRQLIKEHAAIVLNATGGTKVMAFAAFLEFARANKPIFYLDSFNNKAINFNPYSVTEHKVKIPLNIMLAAHGYGIASFRTQKELLTHKPLVHFIDRNFALLESTLAQYRRIVHDESTFMSSLSAAECPFQIQFKRKGGVRIIYGSKEIEFDDYQFLDGLWLEELVYWYIRDQDWDDLLVGVELTYHGQEDRQDILNEIDVMGIKNGKLYLFSCKSGITKDKKDIFELEALRSLAGGTFGKAYFVTSAPIPRDKHLYERCRELGIKIFNHRQFRTIKNEPF